MVEPSAPVRKRPNVNGARQRAILARRVQLDAPADQIAEAKADLAAITLAQHIRRTVAAAPALTAQQRRDLALLLLTEAA
jgi:hypothetical protein